MRTRDLRSSVAIAAFLTASLLLAPAAGAAKPDKGGGGGGKGKPSGSTATMTLVLVDPTDSVVSWGDEIRFDVSAPTTEPHVDVNCTQDGKLVYVAQTGYYDSYPWPWTQTFLLQSGAWTGGEADCVATLYWYNGRKTVTGAVQGFHVSA